jgi:hypothetical protein
MRIEALEPRRLLAGNVTVSVVGGLITIAGDGAANGLEIRGDPTDPRLLTVTPDESTTLNGGADPAVIQDISGHVIVRLRDGQDTLKIVDAGFLKDLRLDLGTGDDLVSIQRSDFHRNLSITGGDGDDRILLSSVQVRRLTGISAEGGKDTIANVESSHRQAIRVLGGNGNDTLTHVRVQASADSTFLLGAGNDELNLLPRELKFDFRLGNRAGWRTGAADWPAGQRDDFQFDIDTRPLPGEIDPNSQGFLISFNNASDDVFGFIHYHLGGSPGELVRDRTYIAIITIDFASNAPSGAAGIGGAPGESVFLKAGITDVRPAIDPAQAANNGLNVDHGEQSTDGAAASVVSNIANGIEAGSVDNVPYVALRRAHIHPQPVTTNTDGQLILLVGVESGFEGTTAVYFRRINVVLAPLPH